MEGVNIENFSEEIDRVEGYQRMSIEGKSMMVSCIRLEHAELKLISMIPYKEFWSTALKSLSFFWGILALCIGVGVSYVISLRKHRTWGKLNAMAKKRLECSNNTISRNKDIAKVVEEIVAEYDVMQGQLASVENMKREDTMYLGENVKPDNDSQAIKQLLIKRISEICRQVSENPKTKGKKDILAEQVKAYIQEHYADAILSNNEIANHFNIIITYLFTIFKEKTGMNLLSYIHKARLDKAKELLASTDLNLEEIGEKVGCNNRVSFIRLFKKYEGITPTEFRMKEREG